MAWTGFDASVAGSDALDWATASRPDHVVALFEHEAEMLDRAGSFLTDGLAGGEAAVIVATPEHIAAFLAVVGAAGLDEATLRATGRLVTLDAADTLKSLLRDDRPDRGLFRRSVGVVIEKARAAGGGHVRAFGEMVALLWESGDKASSLALEGLWNDLAAEVNFRLLCAYATHMLSTADHAHLVAEICHAHTGIMAMSDGAPPPAAAHYPVRAFDPGLEAPGAARRFVVGAVDGLGFPHVADDAALVASELATNAVKHARSHFVVVVAPEGDGVRISVRDSVPVVPEAREATPLDTTGRGIHLVSRLADLWGADLLSGGKVVWARLAGAAPGRPDRQLESA